MTSVPDIAEIPQRTAIDCETCCYAMLLGLAYEDVPDFYNLWKQTRHDERDKWLAERGLCRFTIDMGWKSEVYRPAHVLPPNSPLLIAGVDSPTGNPDGHAVIGRIRNWVYETVYDPSPHREKSGTKPFDLTLFVPLATAWRLLP